MRNVWKIGTRWSERGTAGTSIFKKVFFPNGLAFTTSKRCLEICEGDLFAVADGYSVVALAEAITPGCNVTKLRLENYSDEAKSYLKDPNIYGCRVKYYLLDEEDSFPYPKMGMFFHAGSEVSRKVNELYAKYQKGQTSHLELPRLFNWANKELAQDSFLCWVLQCASSTMAERQQSGEREFGFRFVQALLKKHHIELSDSETLETAVIKQNYNIDVACRVMFGENRYGILIEDKVAADVYNDIENYKKRLAADALFKGCSILPIIVRTGDEKEVLGSQYPYFLRQDFLELFASNPAFEESQILEDFHAHLQQVERRVSAWKTTSVIHWEWDAWKGFFAELQQRGNVKQTRWTTVAGRGRAFLCAFPPWDESVYLGSLVLYWQFESDRQCLALKLIEVYSKHAELRDAFMNAIDAFCATDEKWKMLDMKKPARKGTGYSMTLKIIDSKVWYGKESVIPSIERIEAQINLANEFCASFISAVKENKLECVFKLNQLMASL